MSTGRLVELLFVISYDDFVLLFVIGFGSVAHLSSLLEPNVVSLHQPNVV